MALGKGKQSRLLGIRVLQFLKTLGKNITVSVRHFSLKTCSFTRDARFTTPETGIIDHQLGDHDSEPEIITLDKSEIGEEISVPYYQKLGDADNRFSSLMLQLKSKKERERSQLILLEGQRLIQDALNAGVKPHSIFFSQIDSLQALQFPKKCPAEIYKLPYKQIQLWSNLTTSPGVVGVFEMPSQSMVAKLKQSELPVTLVCDNVREPGNLGAILRVAAGVGCQQVVLTKGCIDLWEPKVLRSGAGAHFRVAIEQGVPWSQLEELVHQEKASVYLADNKTRGNSGLAAQDYSDVNFAAEHGEWLLVLGGETSGLSAEAHQLALHAPVSSKLNIPLCGGVESLNVVAALSIIMFEMRRQRLPRLCTKASNMAAQ